MTTISRNKTLAAAVLAAVTFGTPSIASANGYNSYQHSNIAFEKCQRADHDNKVVGGLLGAVVGGVAGSQVAGSGARTEGSVLGAAIGAIAGAEIGADRRDCRDEAGYKSYKTTQPYSSNTYRSYLSNSSYRTRTAYPIRTHKSGYYKTSHPTRTRTYGHGQGYQQSIRRPEDIQRDIDRTRSDRRYLRSQQDRYYDPNRAYQISDLDRRLDRLEDEKKYAKKYYRRYHR